MAACGLRAWPTSVLIFSVRDGLGCGGPCAAGGLGRGCMAISCTLLAWRRVPSEEPRERRSTWSKMEDEERSSSGPLPDGTAGGRGTTDWSGSCSNRKGVKEIFIISHTSINHLVASRAVKSTSILYSDAFVISQKDRDSVRTPRSGWLGVDGDSQQQEVDENLLVWDEVKSGVCRGTDPTPVTAKCLFMYSFECENSVMVNWSPTQLQTSGDNHSGQNQTIHVY